MGFPEGEGRGEGVYFVGFGSTGSLARLSAARLSDATRMDVVSLFAAVVFAGSWYLRARLGDDDALARLFFGTLMVMAVAIGLLGLALRTLSAAT